MEKINLLESKYEALERKLKKCSKIEAKLNAIETRMSEFEEAMLTTDEDSVAGDSSLAEPIGDVSEELKGLIKESQRKRDLWDRDRLQFSQNENFNTSAEENVP